MSFYSSTLCILVALVTCVAPLTVVAHGNEVLEEVVVEGRRQALVGEALSASEGVVGHDELMMRPLLRTVVTGAISADYPSGWFGSLRLRYFSSYPLIEDGSVESDGSTIANLALGWSNDRWRLQADVLNLFDSSDHDIDYFYASRLPGEPAEGIDDIHYHIFEPRQVRVHASLLF